MLQLNQAATSSVSDSFGSADDIELGENAFYVRLHCALGNKKGGTDLFVAFALCHQSEHVDFAFAQRFAANTLIFPTSFG